MLSLVINVTCLKSQWKQGNFLCWPWSWYLQLARQCGSLMYFKSIPGASCSNLVCLYSEFLPELSALKAAKYVKQLYLQKDLAANPLVTWYTWSLSWSWISELVEAPENEPSETILCQAVGVYAWNKNWRHWKHKVIKFFYSKLLPCLPDF